MLQARHGSTALGMDVAADKEYPRSELSALMQSPCRPEENGYFGATSGIPSKITYRYDIEAKPGTDINHASLIVEEHLMDMVLSVTFPSVCSFEGDGRPPAKRTDDVVITGFRFGREVGVSRCKYLLSQNNCDFFEVSRVELGQLERVQN